MRALRRCLWCWTSAHPEGCEDERAFRAAGELREELESRAAVLDWQGGHRDRQDVARLLALVRDLPERQAVYGRLCDICRNNGAEFDPVGEVERGEVIL